MIEQSNHVPTFVHQRQIGFRSSGFVSGVANEGLLAVNFGVIQLFLEKSQKAEFILVAVTVRFAEKEVILVSE